MQSIKKKRMNSEEKYIQSPFADFFIYQANLAHFCHCGLWFPPGARTFFIVNVISSHRVLILECFSLPKLLKIVIK